MGAHNAPSIFPDLGIRAALVIFYLGERLGRVEAVEFFGNGIVTVFSAFPDLEASHPLTSVSNNSSQANYFAASQQSRTAGCRD
jgi:hypothetical protein